MLRLRLLGDFALTDPKGALIKLKARKDSAMLAFLAMRSEPIDRSQILNLLWGDRAEEQARKSLRQALVSLRHALNLEAEVVPSGRSQSLLLNLDDLEVDGRAFETAALSGEVDRAATLYSGALLQNFPSPTAAFEDWLTIERTRLADLACGVFAEVAEVKLRDRDWLGASEAARTVIKINSLYETGHRLLMRALEGAGRGNDALRQYNHLSTMLRDELRVRPSAETMALCHSMREARDCHELDPTAKSADTLSSSVKRPGLAVLPLRLLDNGHEDVALADGLTDELIASLAAYRWFFVTSALQAAAFRHRHIEPQQLHSELGVRYVLGGVLRRSGNHLTMRLDLSDPVSGQHLWTERIKCYLDEALEAQDLLARRIATTIEPELVKAEAEVSLRVPLKDFSRWERLANARRLAERGDQEGMTSGVELAAEVRQRHPDCAYAQAVFGWNTWLKFMIGGRPSDGYERDDSMISDAIIASETATKIDPKYYLGHAAIGGWQIRLEQFEKASTSLRHSIDLNPSFPTSYNQLISCLTRLGRPTEALSWVKPLDTVSPNDVFRGYYCCVRALTWFFLGNDDEAIANAQESLQAHEGWLSSELVLIAACRRKGDIAGARVVAQRVRQARGTISREKLFQVFPMRRQGDFDTIARQLSSVGLLTKKE